MYNNQPMQQPPYGQPGPYGQMPEPYPESGYGSMQGAPVSGMQLTPDQEQRFSMLDADRSGTISAQEVSRLYEFQFPADCALALIHAINGMSQITRADFGAFDAWMMRFNEIYMQYSQGSLLPVPALPTALQAVGLVVPPRLESIQQHYAPRVQALAFGQFVSICSYVLLCGRIMQKFDTQKKGTITIDYNGMISLGLWFV